MQRRTIGMGLMIRASKSNKLSDVVPTNRRYLDLYTDLGRETLTGEYLAMYR
jgi:hypothetical protein